MAWITTDTDVAQTLEVVKTFEGAVAPDYPKQYSILAAFTGFPAITVEEWHKMETAPRTARLNSFRAYVGSIEGIDVLATETNEPYRPSTEPAGEIVEI